MAIFSKTIIPLSSTKYPIWEKISFLPEQLILESRLGDSEVDDGNLDTDLR